MSSVGRRYDSLEVSALLLWLSDVVAILLAAGTAHLIRFGLHEPERVAQQSWLIGLLLLLLPWVFYVHHLYVPIRKLSFLDTSIRLVRAWGVLGLLLVLVLVFSKTSATYSRVWLALWGALSLPCLWLGRLLVLRGLQLLYRRGMAVSRVLVLTDVTSRMEVDKALGSAMRNGLACVAVVELPVALDDVVAGEIWQDVQQHQPDQIWISLPLERLRDASRLQRVLRDYLGEVVLIPDLQGLRLLNHGVCHVAGLPAMHLTHSPLEGLGRWMKALEDRVGALVLLGVLWPIMLCVAVGVKLSSPGPVFYRQERLTLGGRSFGMLKFRSMPVNVESQSGAVWARPGESRATPFGAFIRRFSLDELPQLFNVLKGDMSLVGPRPERPVFVDQFKEEIGGYMLKHKVKAGITGWAQIHGWRGDTDLDQRIQHDLWYIENWSVWLDLRILAMTAVRVLFDRNAY